MIAGMHLTSKNDNDSSIAISTGPTDSGGSVAESAPVLHVHRTRSGTPILN